MNPTVDLKIIHRVWESIKFTPVMDIDVNDKMTFQIVGDHPDHMASQAVNLLRAM